MKSPKTKAAGSTLSKGRVPRATPQPIKASRRVGVSPVVDKQSALTGLNESLDALSSLQPRRAPAGSPPIHAVLLARESKSSKPNDPLEAAKTFLIELSSTHNLKPDAVVDMLKALTQYFALQAVTQTASDASLPSVAPELWASRSKEDRRNPRDFAEQVYADWIGKGLTRKKLNQLDSDLYRALTVWEARNPEARLSTIPTIAELVDHQVEQLVRLFNEEEMRKLTSLLQAHRRRKNVAA